ncbi:MAG TPA: hypothetical protein VL068_03200 [Microthrixaceae bacterium]|nr:hypothetical protein [Microthrixaceae bacterium]
MPIWDDTFSNWLWKDQEVEAGPTVVFDMDGVLSNASGRQHFLSTGRRDWDSFFHACGEDDLIDEVATLLHTLDSGHRIVLLTARPMSVQPQTLGWLKRHDLRWDCLIMREYGDFMPARVYKRRTVKELRHKEFDLRLAFEDDPRNVDMFHSEGIPCVYIHSGYYE